PPSGDDPPSPPEPPPPSGVPPPSGSGPESGFPPLESELKRLAGQPARKSTAASREIATHRERPRSVGMFALSTKRLSMHSPGHAARLAATSLWRLFLSYGRRQFPPSVGFDPLSDSNFARTQAAFSGVLHAPARRSILEPPHLTPRFHPRLERAWLHRIGRLLDFAADRSAGRTSLFCRGADDGNRR